MRTETDESAGIRSAMALHDALDTALTSPGIPSWVATRTEQDLVDFIEDVDLTLADLKSKIQQATADRAMIIGEIIRRLTSEGRKKIVHPRFAKVELVSKRKRNVLNPTEFYQELMTLVALEQIGREDAEKAVHVVTPDPVVKTDLRAIDKLMRDYGDVAKGLYDQYVQEYHGEVELVMEPLQRNVTPKPIGNGVV